MPEPAVTLADPTAAPEQEPPVVAPAKSFLSHAELIGGLTFVSRIVGMAREIVKNRETFVRAGLGVGPAQHGLRAELMERRPELEAAMHRTRILAGAKALVTPAADRLGEFDHVLLP